MANTEIEEVYRHSPEYPPLLDRLQDAPDPLFFQGRYRKDLFGNTLAVVGSRAATMYGEWVVNSIVKSVAKCGVTIVSGFMYGIDALSHSAALEVGGRTVAVMAGGLTKILPRYQENLYKLITEDGLAVSEYKDAPLGKWMFARRNRIVAGLSQAVLVVEAAESSGSLITAGFARKYGRKVLTVPANLNSRNSYGNVKLLKEGAELVSSADDVLKALFGSSNNFRHLLDCAVNKRLLTKAYDKDALRVVEILRLEPLSVDELALNTGITASKILKTVTDLCIDGLLEEKEGRYYCVN